MSIWSSIDCGDASVKLEPIGDIDVAIAWNLDNEVRLCLMLESTDILGTMDRDNTLLLIKRLQEAVSTYDREAERRKKEA